MEHNPRISVTLRPRDLAALRWLSAEQSRIPAQFAAGLIEDALDRLLALGDTRQRYEESQRGETFDDLLAEDIVHALSCPGVPAVLDGAPEPHAREALRVASWLTMISTWLSSPALRASGHRPTRLADYARLAQQGGDISGALAHVGGADGATVRAAAPGSSAGASDKRGLSDIAEEVPTRGEGQIPPAASPQRRQARHAS